MQGVTWQLTGGVVKNIVPAIASTNAIIAAACTLEALKIITLCSTGLNNYMMCAAAGWPSQPHPCAPASCCTARHLVVAAATCKPLGTPGCRAVGYRGSQLRKQVQLFSL